jgi:phage tail protein X
MSVIYTCVDNEVLDSICYRYYGVSTPATEIVLRQSQNAHLADLGPRYIAGTKIFLPDIPKSVLIPRVERIKLFE